MKHLVKASLLSTALLVGFNAFAGPGTLLDCHILGKACGEANLGPDGANVGLVIKDDTPKAKIIKKGAKAVKKDSQTQQ